jgi:hypothetical protein
MLRINAYTFFSLLFIITTRHFADEPVFEGQRKGTRAVIIHLHKEEEVPRARCCPMIVDLIGEISDPIKTTIVFQNVQLLSMDAKAEGKEQAVTVELVPLQYQILELMQKSNAKLKMKLHEEDKPKK